MLNEYIPAVLSTAKFEVIEDKEPYYGEIPSLPGVFATWHSLERCKKVLLSVLEECFVLRIRFEKNIPPIHG
ncbi:type II toxin-antitoxin system HicB family antitoxin [Methanospirillum hungatei]|uniref:type II toxin-antitoxin system HicB family antitoxin n=1 Tax=Methanospirillum hungatei TaxID=2203 RepID=UPI00350E3D1A